MFGFFTSKHCKIKQKNIVNSFKIKITCFTLHIKHFYWHFKIYSLRRHAHKTQNNK